MRDDYVYPDYLRPYEELDDALLSRVRGREFTQAELSPVADGLSKLVAPGPRWVASAEARGLIVRHDEGMAGRRYYTVA